jgi:exopolysaccharide biosynthesis polyprenyl glycosylphosphotransferase
MFSELIKRHKLTIAFLGDILIFLLSTIIILYGRYGNLNFKDQFNVHFPPLLIVILIWVIIFHITNLYTYKAFHNVLEITKRVSAAVIISFFITITIFYIFSRFFSLTPKANLIMITLVFGILDIYWRFLLMKIFVRKTHQSNVLILATSPLVEDIINHTNKHPQHGYSIYLFNSDLSNLSSYIQKNNIDLIVIGNQYLKNDTVSQILYKLLSNQIEIISLVDFYESLFGSIPLSEVKEEWFLREITKSKNIYESIKHLLEIFLIFITLPFTVPLAIIIGLLVIVTSPGSIIYKQERMGKNNKPFILYKFRTMKSDSSGPLWTTENDVRITFIGKILRHTHLDEIPQLWNVLKGDLSFIGPRAERTKLVKLYEQISYYDVRHIIKPGIIGWAQLNYKASTSVEEAEKKFEFDLYYIKNRSLILDLFITIKTVRTVFQTNK